jgi:hypothetical protein
VRDESRLASPDSAKLPAGVERELLKRVKLGSGDFKR